MKIPLRLLLKLSLSIGFVICSVQPLISMEEMIFAEILDEDPSIGAASQTPNEILLAATSVGCDGDIDLALKLGANINCRGLLRITPLMHAISVGSNETIKRLLTAGADPFLQDSFGSTALHFAAKYGRTQCVTFLLKQAQNRSKDLIKIRNANGQNAMDVGIESKFFDTTKEMFRYAGLTDTFTAKQTIKALESRLFLAAATGDIAGIQTALDDRIRIDSRNDTGGTALHFAAANGHAAVAKFLIAYPCQSLKHSVKINGLDQTGAAPMHLAAQHGHYDTVIALLEANAVVNIYTDEHETPLHLAAANGNTDIVKLLLSVENNINAKTKSGNTALHLAAAAGKIETTLALLAAGANYTIENNEKMTPAALAWSSQHRAIAQIITTHATKLQYCAYAYDRPSYDPRISPIQYK